MGQNDILAILQYGRARDRWVQTSSSQRSGCLSCPIFSRLNQLSLVVNVTPRCVWSALSKQRSSPSWSATNTTRPLSFTAKKFVTFLGINFDTRQYWIQVPCTNAPTPVYVTSGCCRNIRHTLQDTSSGTHFKTHHQAHTSRNVIRHTLQETPSGTHFKKRDQVHTSRHIIRHTLQET